MEIKTLETLLNEQADQELQKEINAALQPVWRCADNKKTIFSRTPFTQDGKRFLILNELLNNLADFMFKQAQEANRERKRTAFLSEVAEQRRSRKRNRRDRLAQ
jgi:hypothetical protein